MSKTTIKTDAHQYRLLQVKRVLEDLVIVCGDCGKQSQAFVEKNGGYGRAERCPHCGLALGRG